MSSQISITLPDSSTIQVERGVTVYDAIGSISKGLQKAALCADIDGRKVDLSMKLENDARLRVITFDSQDGKDVYWHSASHLMAQAIKRLYPGAKFAIGPSIDTGFYYDLDLDCNLVPEDLEKIETEMRAIVAEDLDIRREELSRDEAANRFRDAGEIYKVEMLAEMQESMVSLYHQGEFYDLCRGPHLRRTSDIRAFKLLSIAGAYWRGDEKNKMLQRVYGVAFPSEKELKKYLDMIEEAKKRDHRKLGRELDLFSFSNDVGAGLPLWHPNGAVLRFIIDKFETSEHLKRGYKLFTVPHIARSTLYETSGHLGFYTDNMYAPIQIDGRTIT